MTNEALQKLRYPIGKYRPIIEYTSTERAADIQALKDLPSQLQEATKNMDDQQLDTPYRVDGWSTRQIVHHFADSHMNSFIRFKLALTEDTPTIKPYMEALWAENPDANLPLEPSLGIISGVHTRLTHLLEQIAMSDRKREVLHPEAGRKMSIDYMTGMYAWHSKHHLTQILELKDRKGWQ